MGLLVSFLGASEKLLAEYCKGTRVCFWGYAGLVESAERRELYLFDCSLFNYVSEEHANTPEIRVLLSFRATDLTSENIWFTTQLGYPKLPREAPCTVRDVEECLANSLRALEAEIREQAPLAKRVERWEFLRRLFLPHSRETATTRGRYYGLVLRRSLLSEIAGKLGYVGGVLRSSVRPLYVLYSVDTHKWSFTALVGNKPIELGAHRKLIDRAKLLSALGLVA